MVLGTAAVWSPATMASLLTEVGPERVVAALDVRDGRAAGAGWIDPGRDLADVVGALSPTAVERVLLTSIGRDGTMSGPDLGLLAQVGSLAAELKVIASGGVGSLDDLGALAAAGAEAVVVGRALYEGRFSLGEAVDAADELDPGSLRLLRPNLDQLDDGDEQQPADQVAKHRPAGKWRPIGVVDRPRPQGWRRTSPVRPRRHG